MPRGVSRQPAPPASDGPPAGAPPVDYVCEHCGGAEVTRDAWAEWSTTEQRWQLTTLFDFAFCHLCHRPTRLVAQPRRKG